MTDAVRYALRGGSDGRERLRVLARVMRPTTQALFDRLGIGAGMSCLDVGCGGGDVTLDLAARVGPAGHAVGVDVDAAKVELARAEALERGVANVEFRAADLRTLRGEAFDVVYARFVLSHLADPAAAVDAFRRHLRPGGILVVEDTDFAGYFVHPPSASFDRFVSLYRVAVRGRGGDADIGPRLPGMLAAVGLQGVDAGVVQPMGTTGEVKLVNPLTMRNAADAVVADGLASAEEVEAIVADLYAYADDPTTFAGVVRVVQAWGRAPD
ncbi:MAG TPA: methyltransferase domain-containing protein [Longimicrobiaceae bacterium]|nr:methyltransferase domain-containing protein [Longimicrobiaceae bacterium]